MSRPEPEGLAVGEDVCHLPSGRVGRVEGARDGRVVLATDEGETTGWLPDAECARMAAKGWMSQWHSA